jgi:CRP-like cAMP-binding protein
MHSKTLAARQVLYDQGAPISEVHFLLEGAVAHRLLLDDGRVAEVGMVGPEGFVGMPVLLGDDAAATQAIAQTPGRSWCISALAFREALDSVPDFRAVLFRFAQAFYKQVAQLSACNRSHPLEARLVRWLLMAHERVSGDEIVITHESLAEELGVRRASVTVALGGLAEQGLIASGRTRLHLLDQPGLERRTCECYFMIGETYRRLLGHDWR